MSIDHEAQRTLADVRRLRQRTAAQAHGGVWLPVATLAGLALLSIGLYTTPFHHPQQMSIDVPYWAGLPSEQRNPIVSYAFWFVGTPLAFMFIALWYRWRGRRVGMRVPWHRPAAAGLGVLIALAIIAAIPVPVPQDVPLGWLTATPPSLSRVLLNGVLTPLLAVGVAVTVLGIVERSRATVAAGAWVALLAWLQCTFGLLALPDVVTGGSSSSAKFDLLPGPLLLVMALPLVAFAAVAAARRTPSPGMSRAPLSGVAAARDD